MAGLKLRSKQSSRGGSGSTKQDASKQSVILSARARPLAYQDGVRLSWLMAAMPELLRRSGPPSPHASARENGAGDARAASSSGETCSVRDWVRASTQQDPVLVPEEHIGSPDVAIISTWDSCVLDVVTAAATRGHQGTDTPTNDASTASTTPQDTFVWIDFLSAGSATSQRGSSRALRAGIRQALRAAPLHLLVINDPHEIRRDTRCLFLLWQSHRARVAGLAKEGRPPDTALQAPMLQVAHHMSTGMRQSLAVHSSKLPSLDGDSGSYVSDSAPLRHERFAEADSVNSASEDCITPARHTDTGCSASEPRTRKRFADREASGPEDEPVTATHSDTPDASRPSSTAGRQPRLSGVMRELQCVPALQLELVGGGGAAYAHHVAEVAALVSVLHAEHEDGWCTSMLKAFQGACGDAHSCAIQHLLWSAVEHLAKQQVQGDALSAQCRADALYALGVVYESTQRYADAERVLREAIADVEVLLMDAECGEAGPESSGPAPACHIARKLTRPELRTGFYASCQSASGAASTTPRTRVQGALESRQRGSCRGISALSRAPSTCSSPAESAQHAALARMLYLLALTLYKQGTGVAVSVEVSPAYGVRTGNRFFTALEAADAVFVGATELRSRNEKMREARRVLKRAAVHHAGICDESEVMKMMLCDIYEGQARVDSHLGDHCAALQRHKQVLTMRLELLPHSHLFCAHSRYNIAMVHLAQQDPDAALQPLQEALATYDAELNTCHPLALSARQALGGALYAIARAEGLLFDDSAMDDCRADKDAARGTEAFVDGAVHKPTSAPTSARVSLAVRAESATSSSEANAIPRKTSGHRGVAAARAHYDRALEDSRVLHGNDSLEVAAVRSGLGKLLSGPEGLEHLIEALRIRAAQLHRDHPLVMSTVATVSTAMDANNRRDDADALRAQFGIVMTPAGATPSSPQAHFIANESMDSVL